MNLIAPAPMQRTTVLAESAVLEYAGPRDYIDYPIEIPEGTTGVEVQLDFVKVTDRFQLYAALLEPSGLLRGHVQCPGGPGPRAQRFVITPAVASAGCVSGPIAPGRWTVRIDLDRFRESGHYELRVILDSAEGASRPAAPAPSFEQRVDMPAAGNTAVWLKGELHSHSVHSDGQNSVAEILAEVRALELDFFALSDHFTWSHWAELSADSARHEQTPLVVLPSIEVTTHQGHANVHGLEQWPNVYVDGGGWTCGDLARDVHDQGGLFGVNHPFSGQQAWRRSDIGWGDVDLLDGVNPGPDANNDAAIGRWDRLLAQGYDITPLAGTDCHNIADPEQRLGQVFTYVRCTERSRTAVLAGLRDGATVVSRGAALDFQIRNGTTTVGIGDTISAGGVSLALEIDLTIDEPCALYVIRDGLMWHQSDVDSGTHALVLDDPSPVSGAYRVELHRRSNDPRHWASAWRSHESFEALTGHIRVFVS